MENKISVNELITNEKNASELKPSEQARTEREQRNEQLLKIAFYLQTAIKNLNGHYLKSEKNIQFRIYTPKNTSATIHFLENGNIQVSQPRIKNPQKEQLNAIQKMREIETELINAKIGYMPFLEY